MDIQNYDPTILSAARTYPYRGRLVTRFECEAVKRGDCGRELGCVALVDVSRVGMPEQVEDLRRGICDTAIEVSGAAALAQAVEGPVAISTPVRIQLAS